MVALDLGIDTTAPAGELVANVMAAVAQWDRRVIGERTKDAHAKGVYGGRRSTVPSDARERVNQLGASGYTYRQIAGALNDDQVPTGQGAACWRPNAVRCVLPPPNRSCRRLLLLRCLRPHPLIFQDPYLVA